MERKQPTKEGVNSGRATNLLVSASAGCGKTTEMIRNIVELLKEDKPIDEFAVVTFTNMAAADMKKRLTEKLNQALEDKDDSMPRLVRQHIVNQVENLENASISTLHSFCNELLRSWFYVADVDPAFTILDDFTAAAIKRQAFEEVFAQYLHDGDDDFWRVYQIFSTSRNEGNFRETILKLHGFAACMRDFPAWYEQTKQYFLADGPGNPIAAQVLKELVCALSGYACQLRTLADCCNRPDVGLCSFANTMNAIADNLDTVDKTDLKNAINFVCKLDVPSLGKISDNKNCQDEQKAVLLRDEFNGVRKKLIDLRDKYARLCNNRSLAEMWADSAATVAITDKLVEVLFRFTDKYNELKKQRGTLDFNDLEHLTLELLQQDDVAEQISQRYKYVFVDEYQDVNEVQEELISRLAKHSQLFMVGDIKQSIYGFRGCDSTIFSRKYDDYSRGKGGALKELGKNYRTNNEILQFVNAVFCGIMTKEFGDVDYERTATLHSDKPAVFKGQFPSVQLSLLESKQDSVPLDDVYDMTANVAPLDDVAQGEIIAAKVLEYVGKPYVVKVMKDDVEVEENRKIRYEDIVILMRSVNSSRAHAIYNALASHNVPVTANFKTVGFKNKEVRDIITLLRALDNPYVDIYTVGLCLSPIGNVDEDQLAEIKTATAALGKVPFCTRLQFYAEHYANSTDCKQKALAAKVAALLKLVKDLRFVSFTTTVDELIITMFDKTDYHRYVQGLPNGSLRLSNLYAFVDGLKGAPHAQSIAKFLNYLDEAEGERADEAIAATDAVRIMTMHASKGLEFPIVILAGLDSAFQFDKDPIEINKQVGLAVCNYNFETMRKGNNIGWTACKAANNTIKQREEELRLLYVALTRAEHLLLLVGSVSPDRLDSVIYRQPNLARSHLDWIACALQRRYGATLRELPGIATDITVKIENDKPVFPQRADAEICQQYTDKDAVMAQINWQYPYREQTKMPTKIVSSALDKEFLYRQEDQDDVTQEQAASSGAEVVLVDDSDRNFVGTAYHKVLQYAPYPASKQAIADTIRFVKDNCLVEEKHVNAVDADKVYNVLNNPQLLDLLALGKVYHEKAFMLNVPYNEVMKDSAMTDEVMLQGVIDLLVLCKDSAVVVDFKYTSHSNLARKNYQAQLHSYCLAVSKICGIPQEKIKSYVLSIADNKLIDMN